MDGRSLTQSRRNTWHFKPPITYYRTYHQSLWLFLHMKPSTHTHTHTDTDMHPVNLLSTCLKTFQQKFSIKLSSVTVQTRSLIICKSSPDNKGAASSRCQVSPLSEISMKQDCYSMAHWQPNNMKVQFVQVFSKKLSVLRWHNILTHLSFSCSSFVECRSILRFELIWTAF